MTSTMSHPESRQARRWRERQGAPEVMPSTPPPTRTLWVR